MIWENPDGFETIQKMGNNLEKSRHFISFTVYAQKISGQIIKFQGSNATLLPRVLGLGYLSGVGQVDITSCSTYTRI